MARLIGRRLAQLVAVLLIVSFLTFLMLHLLPADPAYAILGQNATDAQVEAIHQQLGLDQPFVVQYLDWLGSLLTGDLGTSLRSKESVSEALASRLPVSLELAVLATLMSLAFAIPAGVFAAYRSGGKFDRLASAAASTMVAIPGFVLGIFLVYVFAYQLPVLPVSGWVPFSDNPAENLRHAVLPAITLAAVEAAVFMRVLRSDMHDTLQENFILAARAQGLPKQNVLWRSALRPSSMSLVTLAGVSLGRLIGGTVLAEVIFALPGVGQLLVQSIYASDVVMVQGIVIVLVTGVVLINLLVDVLYMYLDPRVRQAA